jgi:ATP/ADP translocase
MHMSSPPTVRTTLSAASEVLRDRYTTRMLVVGMLAAAVGVLIEFQFYLTIAAMGRGNRGQAGLFANAYLWLNGLALALQFWALPRLQRAVGAGSALLVLPSVLLGGGLTLLISASAMLRAALRVAEGGFKSSIHRTSWEQAYLPFDRGRRAIAKLMVDGLGAPVAEGLTAGALLLWTRGVSQAEPFARSNATLLALSVVVFTVTWILATARIRAGAGSGSGEGESQIFSAAMPPPDH